MFGIMIIIFISSCDTRPPEFEVNNFQAPINVNANAPLFLDYTDAIDSGFIIPTIRQTPAGAFVFSFSLKNNKGCPTSFYYKIYYQNESYKITETDWLHPDQQHPLAEENFYGSWENTHTTFKITPAIENDDRFHSVTDTFRIVGNPRDERIYYSPSIQEKYAPSELLSEKMRQVASDPRWTAMVKEKAIQSGISFEEQLKMDATFMVNEDRQKDTVNNRWKRNPRVGKYSFMLVVTTKEDLSHIPAYVKNVSLKRGPAFVNPYYFFSAGNGAALKQTQVLKKDNAITIKAGPDLGSGIYVSRDYFEHLPPGKKIFFNKRCNDDSVMYHKASFMQFVHSIDTNDLFSNIPRYSDFAANDYSPADYRNAVKNYKEKDMVRTAIKIADCPCKTVRSDEEKKMIVIKNPANKPGEYRKENTGVISRHGFTYGKFTAKVKLAELMNKKQVWNGLTNAFWFINQGDDTWGIRRKCNKDGYIPKPLDGVHAQRVPQLGYSEIDFEIRKTGRFWPKNSYHYKVPRDNHKDSAQVIVTCTNWDLACRDPQNFNVGVHYINHAGRNIPLHRWTHWYKAITSKYPANDDELFGKEFYYFQLEWTPHEIIWRIGPSKDRLRVVGYMNEKVTSIPNNQMLMVFTQEYHPSKWWPESQYLQEYIPFLSKDLEGKIMDIEIE